MGDFPMSLSDNSQIIRSKTFSSTQLKESLSFNSWQISIEDCSRIRNNLIIKKENYQMAMHEGKIKTNFLTANERK